MKQKLTKRIFNNHLCILQKRFSLYFKYIDLKIWMGQDRHILWRFLEKHELMQINFLSFGWLWKKKTLQVYQTKQQKFYFLSLDNKLVRNRFSAVAAMRTKYWWRLVIEKEWRVAISPATPRFVKSFDSSVGIALGYGLDDQGSRVRLPAGAGNFSLHHRVQNGSGAHPASYPMGAGGSFPGGKAAAAWNWPLISI
jgi:hypothetical protein